MSSTKGFRIVIGTVPCRIFIGFQAPQLRKARLSPWHKNNLVSRITIEITFYCFYRTLENNLISCRGPEMREQRTSSQIL